VSAGTPHATRSTDVRFTVLTASDTRTPETDGSGRLLVEGLRQAGFTLEDYRIVRDDRDAVETALRESLSRDVDAVVLTGGTGVAPRDQAPDAVARVCEREIPGFGELFRALSFDEIGPAALASRACAWQSGARLVFALPGSPAACRLALDRLLIPQLPHLVSLARGSQPPAQGR
jgi:molybdenum cofactor biosynthesis protein B